MRQQTSGRTAEGYAASGAAMTSRLNIVLVGKGLVGSELLRQISARRSQLLAESGLDLRVRVVAASKTMQVDGEAAPTDLENFPETVTGQGAVVVADCTASADVARLYARWLRAGLHVVAASKLACSGPLDLYRALEEARASGGAQFFYEANVCAGLPVLSTISDLRRTGDRFIRIEGVFSGTLSYIMNEVDADNPFSAIVARAKAAGYTEPDPRDDLAGIDVARKLVILARAVGLGVELADVPVKSLVPSELQGPEVSADTFLTRLPEFDSEISAMFASAAAADVVLRYVGCIDVDTGACHVGLDRYKRNHAFAGLQSSDNVVSLRTERYDAQPLVVRGPGAGAAVTASGVFADILRVGDRLPRV